MPPLLSLRTRYCGASFVARTWWPLIRIDEVILRMTRPTPLPREDRFPP
jgi:hypothetical protein